MSSARSKAKILQINMSKPFISSVVYEILYRDKQMMHPTVLLKYINNNKYSWKLILAWQLYSYETLFLSIYILVLKRNWLVWKGVEVSIKPIWNSGDWNRQYAVSEAKLSSKQHLYISVRKWFVEFCITFAFSLQLPFLHLTIFLP